MAPLSSRLFKLKVGYRLGTIRPKTMSLALLAEQTNEEKDSLGSPSELAMSRSCAPIAGMRAQMMRLALHALIEPRRGRELRY